MKQRIEALRVRTSAYLRTALFQYLEGPGGNDCAAARQRCVTRTVRAVFANVRAFRDSPPDDAPNAAGNVVFFATDGALDFAIPEALSAENATCRYVLRSFQSWEVLQRVPDGPLVTDSRNPLARLQLPVAEEHFAAMNQMLPLDVWLY